jgi:hypothetical protein
MKITLLTKFVLLSLISTMLFACSSQPRYRQATIDHMNYMRAMKIQRDVQNKQRDELEARNREFIDHNKCEQHTTGSELYQRCRRTASIQRYEKAMEYIEQRSLLDRQEEIIRQNNTRHCKGEIMGSNIEYRCGPSRYML